MWAVGVIDDGTGSAPGLRFNDDPDTGIYYADNAMFFGFGGTRFAGVNSDTFFADSFRFKGRE